VIQAPIDPAAELFYNRALRRIILLQLAVLIAGAIGLRQTRGDNVALSFGLGGAIALLNFYWLKQVIAGFLDRVTGTGHASGGGGIVFRFLLRYALIAAVAYVIFSGYSVSAYGFCAGLLVPVPAMMIEAGVEAAHAFRRNS
jgi:hypothetical protein